VLTSSTSLKVPTELRARPNQLGYMRNDWTRLTLSGSPSAATRRIVRSHGCAGGSSARLGRLPDRFVLQLGAADWTSPRPGKPSLQALGVKGVHRATRQQHLFELIRTQADGTLPRCRGTRQRIKLGLRYCRPCANACSQIAWASRLLKVCLKIVGHSLRHNVKAIKAGKAGLRRPQCAVKAARIIGAAAPLCRINAEERVAPHHPHHMPTLQLSSPAVMQPSTGPPSSILTPVTRMRDCPSRGAAGRRKREGAIAVR